MLKIMKYLVATMITFSVFSFGTTPLAKADTLSLSYDVPMKFDFNHGNAHKVTGRIISASLPLFFVGIGKEEYTASGTLGDAWEGPDVNYWGYKDFDMRVKYDFWDVFIDLPFPILNLSVGYGFGTAQMEDTSGVPSYTLSGTTYFDSRQYIKVDPVTLQQTFIRVGIPVGGIFDIHIGYHKITSKDVYLKDKKTGNDIEADYWDETIGYTKEGIKEGDKFAMNFGAEMYTVGIKIGF